MDREFGISDPIRALTARVRKLERAAEGQRMEVRTERLVVVDDRGNERIVGEVVAGGTAELRMDLPDRPPGLPASVMLFTNPGTPVYDLPPGIGVQVWVDGDEVRAFDAWSEVRWW